MTAGTVTLNAGSGGDGVATDEIAGAEYQRVKLVDGTIDGTAAIASGNGTSTNALRVTVSSDSTGVVSVDDNGGSLTVDGTVTANAGTGPWPVTDNGGSLTVDGTVTANLSATDNAVLDNIQTAVELIDNAISGNEMQVDLVAADVTNAGTFAVQVDGAALTALQTIDNSILADDAAFTLASSSVNMAGAIRDDSLSTLTAVEGDAVPLRVSSTGALHVTGGGGGTEYSEDAATPATITGTATMMERDDALSTLTPIEGDWAAMRCDSQGALWVNVVNAEGTTTDDSAFTAGSGTIAVVGGVFDDTTPDSVDEGDAGAVRMSANRNLYGTIRDAAGNERGANVDANNNLNVILGSNTGVDIGDVDVTSVVPGTGATNLGKAADSAAGATDTGVAPLAIRDDTLSALTPAEGDYTPLRVNSTGALHVTGAGGGTQYNVDDAAGATDTVTMAGVVRDDSLTTLTEADGDVSVLRVNSTGALHVTGGGGGTEYTEDSATPATITGTATLMERDDALATLTPVEGDWAGQRCTAEGALWVQDFNSDAILADTANMDTNLGTVAGAVAGTEMQVDVVAALPAGDNNIGNVDIASALPAGTNNIGDVDIASALPAGTNNIGDVDIASITAGANLIGDVGISGARTSGGTTFFNSNDLDETGEQVKGTAGQIYFITCFNVSASLLYLQVFNATAASVTVGTTAPDMVFPIPTQGDTNGAGFVLAVPNGIEMDTAITVAATTTATGNTGPGANEVLINVGYA